MIKKNWKKKKKLQLVWGGSVLVFVWAYIFAFWGLLKRNKTFTFLSFSLLNHKNLLLTFFLREEKKVINFVSYSGIKLSHQPTMSLGYAEKLSYIEDVGNVGMTEHFDPSHVLLEKVGPFLDVSLFCSCLHCCLTFVPFLSWSFISSSNFYACGVQLWSLLLCVAWLIG